MCTVTFFRDKDNVIITSNRDENISRPPALKPTKYVGQGKSLIYPKDTQSNGSWFVVNSVGDVLVLLNGACQNHIKEKHYKKSRGLILLDLAYSDNYMESWHYLALESIEPFTIIIYSQKKLFQMQWNGTNKKSLDLSHVNSSIWSSATLYKLKIAKNREEWFNEFLLKKSFNLKPRDLIAFHSTTHPNDPENGLIINRNNKILTKSITQCCITQSKLAIRHIDLLSKEEFKIYDSIS